MARQSNQNNTNDTLVLIEFTQTIRELTTQITVFVENMRSRVSANNEMLKAMNTALANIGKMVEVISKREAFELEKRKSLWSLRNTIVSGLVGAAFGAIITLIVSSLSG